MVQKWYMYVYIVKIYGIVIKNGIKWEVVVEGELYTCMWLEWMMWENVCFVEMWDVKWDVVIECELWKCELCTFMMNWMNVGKENVW